jgi:CHAT domain-containing protein/tetratricopeptide (TPR) repeat protein
MSGTHDERTHGQELSGKKEDTLLKRVFSPFKEALAAGQLGLGQAAWRLYQTTGQLSDLNRALEHFQAAATRGPSDSRDHPAFLTALGIGLHERYIRTGDLADLDRAIEVWDEAVQLMPPGSPSRPGGLNNVGIGLYERYSRSGDIADLEGAIRAYEEALQETPPHAPSRPSILNNLGNELHIHYLHSGNTADLDRAIRLHEEAVRLVPADAPERPDCLNSLADVLRIRYTFGGNLSDLDRAIQVCEEAIQRTPLQAPNRPGYLSTLGSVLRLRYAYNGDQADLKRAIEVLDEAVQRIPTSVSNRPAYLNNLGSVLIERYKSIGDSTDLDRAIKVWDEAVQASPPGSPDLPILRANLGLGLGLRYTRSGVAADLDRAIQVWDEAVQQVPPGSSNRPVCLINQGVGLRVRYDRTGDLADLDRAIQVWDDAVRTSPPGSSVLPVGYANLGAALRVRSTQRGDPTDLARAIEAYQDAITRVPANSPEWPTYFNDLGNAWRARYDYSQDRADLEHAIQAWEEARKRARPGSPSIHASLVNLGSTLRLRYTLFGNPSDLDRAIQLHEQVVQQTAPGSPTRPINLNSLGNDLYERYAHSGDPVDLERAATAYEDACRSGIDVDPGSALMAASNWGDWALGRNAWTEAVRAYTYGLDAADQLFRVQLLRSSKESWLRAARNLHAHAAFAFAQTGDLRRAVETLEQGHARLLSQALERDRADLGLLQTVAPDVYEQYTAAANRLRWLENQDISGPMVLAPDQTSTEVLPHSLLPADQALAAAIRQAHADLDAAVKAVHQVPGYAGFLMPTSFEQIQQAMQDTPLVYLAATPAGGLALVVSPPTRNEADGGESEPRLVPPANITPLWLKDLTAKALGDRLVGEDEAGLGGYLGAYMRWKADNGDRDAWLTALDETTRWLWDTLMGPLTQTITDLGSVRAILIPQGALGLLPLHAAWREDPTTPSKRHYAMDTITFTYIPNARAFAAAQEGATRAADALLAIDNPLPVRNPLKTAGYEVEVACAFLPHHQLMRNEQAVLKDVRDALPTCAVLHFNGHGYANLVEPLESGLVMANEQMLTLRDLLNMRLTAARVVVLSACETAVAGVDVPDEVIGLPTGLLQAGVTGVIASLWKVEASSTMMLLIRFYELWCGEKMSPPEALRRAQIWLRDTSIGEKLAYFERFQGNNPPVTLPADLAWQMYWAVFSSQSVNYAHPFFWAAFGYTGI